VAKDPLYLKLLNPPQGNEFLQTYSPAYRSAWAEIDAKFSGIGDEALRSQARNEEWARVLRTDGDKFSYEAEVAFREAKISFSRGHRDGWLEIGRASYNGINGSLVAAPNSNAPIDGNFHFPMGVDALNEVYTKFHQIAAEEIDRKAHEHVANSGAGSNCSRNPDWCYNFAKQDIEQSLRSERIVVVAQGDLENSRVDRLLLVDSDTETVLLDLGAPTATFNSAAWRFSVGPVPTPPQPPATEAQIQPAAANASPARVILPANEVAASILSHTAPAYPAKARSGRIQGEVVLHAIIDGEGKIAQLQVLSGDDLLAESALEAVREWRYKPLLLQGATKEVDTTITVTFSLKD
jgi:TonB family protein